VAWQLNPRLSKQPVVAVQVVETDWMPDWMQAGNAPPPVSSITAVAQHVGV
jgi:hypothetical protein